MLTAVLALPALGDDEREREREGYAIGLWGDLPYNDLQAQTGVPNLIADVNAQNLAFTIHDGDLKGGNGIPGSATPTTCADPLYYQALGFFNSLKAPAMTTPGDNDWTDCDRPSNGGFNSLERLQFERTILFSTPFSLGQRRMRQEVQAPPYVENRRWSFRGVMFVTLNVQGSCNNLCDTAPDPVEFAARDAANIAWLRQTFQKAKATRAAAVMVIAQTNPGWDTFDARADVPQRDSKTLVKTNPLNTVPTPPDGYEEYLKALRDEVIAFGSPVAYVHGDSHFFRIDRPLLDSTGKRLENFTRVETFGDNAPNGLNDVHWLKVFVDPRSREVFAYQAQIVPANRVAVPAP
jgi:hypothetical protein